ncbi:MULTISPECIES: YdeI/OmpD-associated family protein [Pseudoalteromonas]|uniref:DUF1905 domain-containing protein n=1 Tax=Pseudoalteromonas amylolytica TaxID=1859457 RepID=A0A1S1MPG1_9GAMM|nr:MULTISPECIES: YdeI/OmpD-associated family protein [Pseudoalteromonas]OHU86956.1 hypothetical protein BFC16_12885 [Pseudoalteromonas sp. JW3]OHU88335.1 hypothetical protein BET10_19875 [Pseudoalteromonas amylolytica]
MTQQPKRYQFTAQLLRPKYMGDGEAWAFVVLPHDVSACLPRRGRTTVVGYINEQPFQQLLEPDGQKSHWLKLDETLLKKANTRFGELAHFEIQAIDKEPEPDIPHDLLTALEQDPLALRTWQATTTIARVDWIHWITTAKQAKTRLKRINDACSMLSEGKKRVCCFDTSGFYSKALSAPQSDN